MVCGPTARAAQASGLLRPHTCRLVPGSLVVVFVRPQRRVPEPWPGPARPTASPVCPLASQDRTCEIVEDTESSRMVKKMKKRICLVLDCLCAHDFSDKTADLINLQHYVIKEKRLSERETVVIFYDVVRVVEALHQVRLCPLRPLLPWPGSVLGPTCLRKQQQLWPTLSQVCFAAGSVPKESGQMIRTQC